MQERAGDLEELVTAEFSRLREFLLGEEEHIKERLQKQKEEKLNQLEEALTQTTEQISQLESTADQLRLKLTEEENPEQLKVRESRERMIKKKKQDTKRRYKKQSRQKPKNIIMNVSAPEILYELYIREYFVITGSFFVLHFRESKISSEGECHPDSYLIHHFVKVTVTCSLVGL